MTGMNRVFGVVGWKNSGKTTLLVDLVRAFQERGLSVSTVKHAHHHFDIDRPGKDSFLHREAGAGQVMIASDRRWALMTEHGGQERPTLAALVEQMSPADIVLAEGFKADPHPKLEVRRDYKAPLLAHDDRSIRAVVTPDPSTVTECPCPVLPRDDVAAIVAMILKTLSN